MPFLLYLEKKTMATSNFEIEDPDICPLCHKCSIIDFI